MRGREEVDGLVRVGVVLDRIPDHGGEHVAVAEEVLDADDVVDVLAHARVEHFCRELHRWIKVAEGSVDIVFRLRQLVHM